MTIEHRSESNGLATRNGGGNITAREDFGGQELATLAETASTAAAAQAQAAIQARYIMAMKRPRDWDDVRVRLLKECARPSFAEVAIYHKPIGQGVEGPSIRFVETALRCMGNNMPECATVYDDQTKRIVRVTVTDLESNVTYSKDVTIDKTVERSQLRQGQTPIGKRTNAQGRMVYIVAATDDDLLNKEGSLVSKAIRTNGLRLIPGDLVAEAEARIRETLNTRDAADPDAARKKLTDGFATLNVMPSDLKEYLGHDLGTASPAEIVTLRNLFVAIRDGEASWTGALEAKHAERAESSKRDKAGDAPKGEGAQPATKVEAAKAKLKGEKQPETPKEPPALTGLAAELVQAGMSAAHPGELAKVKADFDRAVLTKKIEGADVERVKASLESFAAAFSKAEREPGGEG
jgi:hypothetical protein